MANPVGGLLGAASGLARTRLELAGTELREELARFGFLLLGGCAAIILAALALAAVGAGLIIAAGEQRVWAALCVGALFAAAAAFAALRVRAALAAKPVAFAASLAELERDREALVERSQESRSAIAESGGELMRLVSLGLLAYSIGRRLRRAARS